MTVRQDVQTLRPGAIVELFVLDASGIPGGSVSRFHAGTNGLDQPVTWQGNAYTPWPVQASGFEVSGTGKLPRPQLAISNVLGTIGAMCLAFDDLVGATVTRKRTLAKYLDAANFPGGNPNADPSEQFPDDVFVVEQRVLETKEVVQFQLSARMDMEGVKLPRRVVTQSCGWVYKGAGCGYVPGSMFTLADAATADPAQDRCGKRLLSCELRFGSTAVLPFGGFPGAGLAR